MQDYKYSLSDVEMMLPWEREVYVGLLIEDLKQQEQERSRG